jgi:hypothetical protein
MLRALSPSGERDGVRGFVKPPPGVRRSLTP